MNIYVGNLPSSVSEGMLKKLFEQFGNVTTIKIIKDKFSGEPRGFAFVEMTSNEEAKEAISNLDGTEFEGRRLRVNEARPQKTQRPRPGGGGRYR